MFNNPSTNNKISDNKSSFLSPNGTTDLNNFGSLERNFKNPNEVILKKQNIIGENDLSISMVQSLQESLDSKQNLLPETNALVIGQITNLDQILHSKVDSSIVYTQSEIDNKLSLKQPVLKNGDITINMVNQLHEILDSKQSKLAARDALSIDQISNLQPILDEKADVNTVYIKGQIDDKLSKKQDVLVEDSLPINIISGLSEA